MKRVLTIAVLVMACGKQPAKQAADQRAGSADQPAPVATAAAGDPCSKAHPEDGTTMPWISDDLPAAMACAQQRKVPVVIDMWAPWCHTCLSMRSTVFTDPSFKPDVDRFVFAALDTDKDVNAPAVAKYAPTAWPTFYVVGNDGAVLARFSGATSLAQFHTFLDAGVKAQQGGAAGADAKLLTAERALAAKDLVAADQDLTAALAEAPADWPRRPEVLTALMSNKHKRKDHAGCLDVATKSMDDTGNAAAATDFIVIALGCADGLKDDPSAADKIKAVREHAEARLAKLVDDPAAPLSVDDRSDALATLREAQDALGKHDAAHASAERQKALLDAAAAKATAPMAAMTYNWQRCDVYNYLGKPLELVPALEKSASDLPHEYDPRVRLGWIYLKAGKLPEAARWTDEALTMVYGPRKARVLGQRAEIASKQGDKPAERKAREDLVKLWQAMPAGQDNPEALAQAQQDLAKLDAPAAPAAASKG